MNDNNGLKADFAHKKLIGYLIFFFFFLVGIIPILLIYFLAPDRLHLFSRPTLIPFLILPILSLFFLILSFFISSNHDITKMEIKHNHFFMTIYDKDKTKHDLSIPLNEIQSVKLFITQIFNCDRIKNVNDSTIITIDREITKDNCIKADIDYRYGTIIYQLTINLKEGKSFNIITEIRLDSSKFKEYFDIPRLLPNFSYEVKDIVTDSDIIKKRIDSYILNEKGLGFIGEIYAFFTSKNVPKWRKVGLFLGTVPLILFLIVLIIYNYLFVK